MKCLIVADLHYTLKQFDWLNTEAGTFDVVIVAGDLLDIASMVERDVQILVLTRYFRRIQPRTRVIVSSGNQDGNARNAADEGVARWLQKFRALGCSVDGDSFEYEDFLITVCPWWNGSQSKAEVAALLEKDAARRGDKWFWVYHAPPDHSPVSWTGHKFGGDPELVDWIRQYQPQMVFSGHIHQSPFQAEGSWIDRIDSTWVFNTGRQIGPCPTHIELDTTAQTAVWRSLAGNEIVNLDRPLQRDSYPG